jgi:hypothetical protein
MTKYLAQSSKRLDIVRYPLTDIQRVLVRQGINQIIKKTKLYDVKGYAAFISQMPYLSWFKIIKPSKNLFYCSDAVTYCLEEKAGVEVSPKNHDFTAPVDLQITALKNQEASYDVKWFTLKDKGELL